MAKLFKIFFFLLLMTHFHLPVGLAESQKTFVYDAKGRRDPFLQWAEGGNSKNGVSTQDLRVEGIIFDPAQGSLVVINGVVLKEGDSVGSYKVSKIEKNRVLISKKEGALWLPLKTGDES